MTSHCLMVTSPSLCTKYEWWNNTSSFLCWHPRGYVMTNHNHGKDSAHYAWCWFFEHELSWIIASSYGLNTQWFHVELFQTNDATLQKHSRWLKVFFIMNLVVNFCERKLTRTEVKKMKKIVFSKLWKYDAYYRIRIIRL